MALILGYQSRALWKLATCRVSYLARTYGASSKHATVFVSELTHGDATVG